MGTGFEGLPVDVIGSSTEGTPKTLTLIAVDGKRVRGPFAPMDRRPAVIVVGGKAYLASANETGICRERKPDCVGPMFGGSFIFTSDGRFSEAIGDRLRPVPLFDRWETPAQYATYD
jgi:hypothetical protein